MASSTATAGQVIDGRYRLERQLAGHAGAPATGAQGELWLASDQLAAAATVLLRRIGAERDQARARDLWGRLQGVLHPQVPRFGAAIADAEALWLVREWQTGRTYQMLLEARRERQLVFGAGEVLLLLRQLLPVLAALHSQELLHGDLSPANLLRRDSDGLPVLLDFGLVRGTASRRGSDGAAADPIGATPGYAPPELVRGEPAQPWMDLHALGVVALVLLSGDEPAALLDPVTLDWRWPAALESEPALLTQLQRLLAREPGCRFASAGQALLALQGVEMPDSTGPVPRADRTVVLVPPPAPEVSAAPPAAPQPAASLAQAGEERGMESDGGGVTGEEGEETEGEEDADEGELLEGDRELQLPLRPPAPPRPDAPLRHASARSAAAAAARRRDDEREQAAEGGLWPVLVALVLSAVVGTALGWWWLSRGSATTPEPEVTAEAPASLPPGEVDQRQQLLNRLRAMQVDRSWFLRLVDASLLAQYPERRGRLPSDSLEDAPLRKVWNELAEEWLARVEQLPLPIRRRLGSFSQGDWQRRQQALVGQGLSSEVLGQLVSASAQNLLPGRAGKQQPEEPFRQLWYAAAEQILENVKIEPIEAPSLTTQVLSADVPASGARLFPIRLPAGHRLALGVNGTPLLQMSVYAADGTLLEAKGPLRVVTLGAQPTSPVQLLVTNEGVAPAMIRLSLRADPPPPEVSAPPPPQPGDVPPPTEDARPGSGEPGGSPPAEASAPVAPAAPPTPPPVPAAAPAPAPAPTP